MRLPRAFSGRRLLIATAGAAALGAAACLAQAFVVEPNTLVVRHEQVSIKGAPPLRLVLLADIHGGARWIDRAKLDEIVRVANAQSPDLVLLLGDYVTGHREPDGGPSTPRMSPEEVASALGMLKARSGVLAVLGNHDWWFDAHRVRAALEAVGIRVLEDEAIQPAGTRGLWFVGLTDQLEGQSNPRQALQAVPNGEATIVFVHEPDVFPELPSGISLTLAGHTHGGQVELPFLGRPVVPSRFGQRYATGWIEESGRRMFVTSGIGTSILPVRFRVPPELVVLDINANGEGGAVPNAAR